MKPGREAVLAGIAPACLVALALSQVVLVQTAGLSPWKGGGFGMFSTNDHGGFRVLRVVAVAGDGGERPVRVPEELRRRALRARELPTPGRLGALARALAGSSGAEGARALRVEVRRLAFDAELAPALEPFASVTVELDR